MPETGFKNATRFVSVVAHSGKHTNTYTFKGITYYVMSTFHDDYSGFGKNYPKMSAKTKKKAIGMPNWIIGFKHDTKTWTTPKLLGSIGWFQDGHNGPSITITSKGIIYVFFGNHREPIYYTYTRSILDLSSFVPPIRFPKIKGEGYTSKYYTYPGVRIDPYDTIHITYRGPFYDFTYFKLEPDNNNKITHKTLIKQKDFSTLNGVTLENKAYRAYRDAMTIDKNGTVYIVIKPSIHTKSWNIGPIPNTGTFVIYLRKNHTLWKFLE
jgi:hypothetical protein